MQNNSNRRLLRETLLLFSIILLLLLSACDQALKQPTSTPEKTVTARIIPTPTMATNDPPGSSDNTVQVTVANGIAYAGTSNQDVYALRTNNGSLLWHAQVEGSVQELPLVVHDIVYISSLVGQDGPAYLSALRTGNGTLLCATVATVIYTSL